jgi:hypothetical protein
MGVAMLLIVLMFSKDKEILDRMQIFGEKDSKIFPPKE